tara:strand:+ start:118 stop:429 length:312 start_codon:yes stop_codon:yes gene_type:complete
MKKIILFKNTCFILLSSILLSCYSNSKSLSIATFTLDNKDCSNCHLKLIEDLNSMPGIIESDAYISQDNMIIIINLSYNTNIITIEKIDNFFTIEGFNPYNNY